MSNCLKCNHCGAIGVEETVIGKDGVPTNFRRAKDWAYVMQPSESYVFFLKENFWHLCPTCTGYLEVFMGERKPHYLSDDTRYAYKVPATVEGPNAK